MATIGLDRLYYAKITEDEIGEETYAAPVPLAKAISADMSVELAEAILYADDGAAEIVKEFKNGTMSLGIDWYRRLQSPFPKSWRSVRIWSRACGTVSRA